MYTATIQTGGFQCNQNDITLLEHENVFVCVFVYAHWLVCIARTYADNVTPTHIAHRMYHTHSTKCVMHAPTLRLPRTPPFSMHFTLPNKHIIKLAFMIVSVPGIPLTIRLTALGAWFVQELLAPLFSCMLLAVLECVRVRVLRCIPAVWVSQHMWQTQ